MSLPLPAADALERPVEVVLNARSGAKTTPALAERIAGAIAARGFRPRLSVATSALELREAARRVAASDADLVVAGGGDGTIAAVAGHLAGSDKVLGVLPLGTFNFFARRFGIPADVEGALDVLASGTVRRADAGEVNGRLFLNNASLGLYPAVLVKRESTYRALGRSRAMAYASVALALLQPPALLNLRIEADGTRLSRRTPLLFVGANGFQMENLAIPGRECVRLAHLAAYVARPLSLAALWRLALRAFFRGLHGASELEVVCARRLDVRVRRRRVRLALDGELVTLDTPLAFRMWPGALRVLGRPAPASSGDL